MSTVLALLSGDPGGDELQRKTMSVSMLAKRQTLSLEPAMVTQVLTYVVSLTLSSAAMTLFYALFGSHIRLSLTLRRAAKLGFTQEQQRALFLALLDGPQPPGLKPPPDDEGG